MARSPAADAPTEPPGRSAAVAAAQLVLLASAALALVRVAGTSPILWMDTVNDQVEVRRCIEDDSCSLSGVQTSIRGLSAAVSWLQLRTLATWAGAGLGDQHRLILFLDAVALGLLLLLGNRLGGAIAGSLAVLLVVYDIGGVIRMSALHNSVALLFLGTVLLLSCSAAVARPGIGAIVAAAASAAILANVHLVGAVAGLSVALVALAAPRRKLLHAAAASLLFVSATIALAPTGWIENALALLGPSAQRTSAQVAGITSPTFAWASFAVAALALSIPLRGPIANRYRHSALAPIAIVLPLLATFVVATSFGFAPEAKYLAHAKPAIALAAALVFAASTTAATRALRAERLRAPLAVAVSLACAGLVAVPSWSHSSVVEPPALTFDDLDAAIEVLDSDLEWSRAQILQRLKSPPGIAVLTAAMQHPLAGLPQSDTDDAVALFAGLPPGKVPRPLPDGWYHLGETADLASVLVVSRAAIDWNRIEVCAARRGERKACDVGEWTYTETSGVRVSGMPPAGVGWTGDLRLRLRLLPSDREQVVALPAGALGCSGAIAAADGGAIEVSRDRRVARLSPAGDRDRARRSVEIVWRIGSPECTATAYDGLPPFIIEGDAETVAPLVAELAGDAGRESR